MSVESISRVLNHSTAKGTAKLVLVGIANHDGDGGAWPSIATLARYANTTPRSVQRAIEQLVDMGELVVEYNAGGTLETRSDQRPNRYRITVTVAVDNPGESGRHGVTSASPRRPNGVTSVTERGDAGDVHGVTPASPEPSLNHPQPAAAAAAGIDDQVDALRYAFADRTELEAIAFTMSADQRAVLAGLLDRHGVDKLLRTALATNGGRVRRVTAFFGTWSDLVTPEDAARARSRDELLRRPHELCPDCQQPTDACTAMNRKLAPADQCAQGATHPDEVAY